MNVAGTGSPAGGGDAGASSAGDAGAPEPSSAGAPPATGDDDAVAQMAAWRERKALATCERQLRCIPLWPSLDDCLANADNWPDYSRYFGGVDQDVYFASKFTLADPAVLDACIDAVTNLPCDDSRTPYEACLDVLVPDVPRKQGDRCAHDSGYVMAPACDAGLVCTGSYFCDTCEPLPPASTEGQACDFDEDCAAGLACVRAACVPYASLPGAGEACSAPGVCRDGLECGSGGTCFLQSGEGAPCDPNDPDSCFRDLLCEVDAATGNPTCHAFGGPGATCARATGVGTAGCDENDWCVFATADAPTGTCGVAPLTAGPCALFGGDSTYFCPAGSYPDADQTSSTALPASCSCKPALGLGARCHADPECGQGYCGDADGDGDDDDLRCTALLPDGAPCSSASPNHCASEVCDPDTGTCGAQCQ
ncbi:MAG TPA: hypothetical protein VMI54_05600 [Polyangiaceae bacterium]|nr:hypothetical protein [Polyangiaceae bacterium]